MPRKIPTIGWVWADGALRAELEQPGGAASVRVESAAWFAWLEQETAQRFAYGVFDRQLGYIVSFVTVRKERRQRGGDYWVAYQRVGGRLRKAYVGRSAALTADRLATAAEQLRPGVLEP